MAAAAPAVAAAATAVAAANPPPAIVGFPPVAPLVGGVINGVPWTGGKPGDVNQNTTTIARPRTPACFRPVDSDKALKVYAQVVVPAANSVPFKQNNVLANFKRSVMKHLESKGMDAIAYLTPPHNPTEFVNIITHHLHVTLEMVTTYWNNQVAANEVDDYEMDNLCFFRDWLLASLDPDLATLVMDKLSPDGLGPEAWMLLVLEIRSKSFLYYKSLKTSLKSIKLSQFPGDNVRNFTAAWVKTATKLQIANTFDYNFLVNLITELTKTTVQLFVIAMAGLHTWVLQFTNQLRLLAPAAQAAIMGGANAITYRSICMEADNLYRLLLENGKWTPATSVKITTTPPEFHAITSLEQFNALVQQARAGGSGTPGRGRDPAKVACFNYQHVGHYANKCPHPKVVAAPDGNAPCALGAIGATPGPVGVPNWKRTPPVAGQVEIKEVKLADGSTKTYHWCARCGRYTPSHGKANHTDPNPRPPGAHAANPPPANPGAPGPVEANVAVQWTDVSAWN